MLKGEVDEVLAGFNDALSKKGIRVVNTIDESIVVNAERVSLNNVVLSNLLSNAIKYSYPNSKVELSAEETEFSVVVTIKDYGMGIPEFLLPQIFNPRKVTRRAGTLNEQGTGYGMGLVKKIMKVYGGAIDIESVAKSADNRKHFTSMILTFQKAKSSEVAA